MKRKRFSVEQILRADPESGDQRTDVLPLEEAVHRLGDRPSSSTQAAAGRLDDGAGVYAIRTGGTRSSPGAVLASRSSDMASMLPETGTAQGGMIRHCLPTFALDVIEDR